MLRVRNRLQGFVVSVRGGRRSTHKRVMLPHFGYLKPYQLAATANVRPFSKNINGYTMQPASAIVNIRLARELPATVI